MTDLPPTVPTVLLPELLGFSPQLLLDDIINIANDAATTTVNGMEDFLLRWADDRASHHPDWDGTQEVEQGLVAFQTLLESHTDIAFDFLEVWSLRNIFAFPPDLPIVAPHHAGLDLTHPQEEETELMAEIDELRRQIDNQRRLKRLYTRAVRKSTLQLHRSRTRLDRLSFLSPSAMQSLAAIPQQLDPFLASLSSLPPIDPEPAPEMRNPGTREWEASKSGYLNWAAGVLVKRTGAATKEEVANADGVKGILKAEGAKVEETSEEDRRQALSPT